MKRLLIAGATLCLFAVAGCESNYKVVTADVQVQMLDDLKMGKLTLDCTASCMMTWISQASTVHVLDMSERWKDLAIKVMQIGFGEDLSYYYLGQAAQGLGYHKAAINIIRYRVCSLCRTECDYAL